MMRYLSIVLAAMITLALAGCSDNKETTIKAYTSPSGIAYHLVQIPEEDEDVSIQIAWPTDWAYRDETNKAAPYVGAQLILAGGAEGYKPGEAGEKFADLKSEANLSPSVDHIYGRLFFKKENMDETIKIANAHLRKPSLDEKWFERVRDGVKKKIEDIRADDTSKVFAAIRWSIFGDQPLHQSLDLYSPDVFKTLTRDNIQEWHDEVLTRTSPLIVIAGNITQEEAGKAIDQLLEGLPDHKHPAKNKVVASYKPHRILLYQPDAEKSFLGFVGKIPSKITKNTDGISQLQINAALGGDEKSALMDSIRTELRASYSFSSFVIGYNVENSVLAMSGGVDTAKLADAEKLVRKTYTTFRNQGLGDRFERQKSDMKDWIDDLPKQPDHIASAVIQSLILGQSDQFPLEQKKRLADLTVDVPNAYLENSYPDADNLIMVAISPDRDALPGACIIEKPSEAVNCQ